MKFLDLYLAILDRHFHCVPYNGVESGKADEFQDGILILKSRIVNPESYTINRNLFESLGEDSRMVISTICLTPEKVMTPRTGNITIASVSRHLRKKEKWPRYKVERVFREITNYLRLIEGR